jgi:hypothetical protein
MAMSVSNGASIFAHPGWDAAQAGPLQPGIAVAVTPGPDRLVDARIQAEACIPGEPAARPPSWTPAWRDALLDGMAHLLTHVHMPGAWFPTLGPPRFVHGQSQGICDLFGAEVEAMDDGNYFVHPLPADPEMISRVFPRELPTSRYWGAVEWICYAASATEGRVQFRNPVMTGPFDTANYLLGTTTLLEWVYTETDTLHRLLAVITEVIIAMLTQLRQAAGGRLHGDALSCMRNALCLCSECRSLVSAEIYEAFEAPYLARIGHALGPYGIHSCGGWEHTVPSALRDPYLRAMNGQIRENDLAVLCREAGGAIVLSIGPSVNLDERYTWPDTHSFLAHILDATPPIQPLEITLSETDLPLWRELLRERGDRCRTGT